MESVLEIIILGWTSYDKRVLYQTYDIKHVLKIGQNDISAMVGNGWYKGRLHASCT